MKLIGTLAGYAKRASVQLTYFELPTGQWTEVASACRTKVDGYLRAVSARAGHRCEFALGRTRVDWSISGSLDGADSEPSDVHRCDIADPLGRIG